jgi:hypothetical protein
MRWGPVRRSGGSCSRRPLGPVRGDHPRCGLRPVGQADRDRRGRLRRCAGAQRPSASPVARRAALACPRGGEAHARGHGAGALPRPVGEASAVADHDPMTPVRWRRLDGIGIPGVVRDGGRRLCWACCSGGGRRWRGCSEATICVRRAIGRGHAGVLWTGWLASLGGKKPDDTVVGWCQ